MLEVWTQEQEANLKREWFPLDTLMTSDGPSFDSQDHLSAEYLKSSNQTIQEPITQNL